PSPASRPSSPRASEWTIAARPCSRRPLRAGALSPASDPTRPTRASARPWPGGWRRSGSTAAPPPAAGRVRRLAPLDRLGPGPASAGPVPRPRDRAELLRVPIGVTPDGNPVVLDLKEAAEAGIGPHGLVVGATGSGKSELLRTTVAGTARTPPPAPLRP